jgi:hypothetical protein
MSERKGFLLRIPPELYAELERWARDDLRSVNAQIEFVLTKAVRARRGEDRPRPRAGEDGQGPEPSE